MEYRRLQALVVWDMMLQVLGIACGVLIVMGSVWVPFYIRLRLMLGSPRGTLTQRTSHVLTYSS